MKKRLFLIVIIILIMLASYFYFNSSDDDLSDKYNDSKNNDYSYNGWTYNPNEYPKSKYHLNEIPSVNNPSYAMNQFFNDSDFNNDGVLEGREISAMDYKLKHSQYNYNGPYDYN